MSYMNRISKLDAMLSEKSQGVSNFSVMQGEHQAGMGRQQDTEGDKQEDLGQDTTAFNPSAAP